MIDSDAAMRNIEFTIRRGTGWNSCGQLIQNCLRESTPWLRVDFSIVSTAGTVKALRSNT